MTFTRDSLYILQFIKIYNSYIRIILINKLIINKRIILYKIIILFIFTYKIIKDFIKKDLIIIFKKGKSI